MTKRKENFTTFGAVGLQTIDNWDHWFGNLCRNVRFADTEDQIQISIEKLRPYVDQKWCLPTRMDEINKIADHRRKELRR